MGFPGGSDGKKKKIKSACNARDLGSIPGSGRSPGEGNGYPLQYSYLDNSMDREAWGIIVYGVAESEKTESLTLYYFYHGTPKAGLFQREKIRFYSANVLLPPQNPTAVLAYSPADREQWVWRMPGFV